MRAFGKSENENLYCGDPEKPWEPKHTAVLTKDDFPSQVICVLSNMIYIDKDGISSKGIAQFKRLASFKNPDFYKAQTMRLSTYGKPRIISTFDDTEQYIGLPRGLFDELMQLFINHSVDVNIIDKTNAGRLIDVAFKGELRPEQETAKAALVKKNYGVLSASTAFGKTVVGAAMIVERKVNTLILVHRTNLMKQWIERLNEFLDINEEPPVEYTPKGRKRKKSVIGQIGGTKNNTSGIIDVAVMQSLVSKGEVKDIVKNYGMIIVDECHHVSAFTFEQILKAANARYVYGLTATPTRQDGHHPIIYMQCGPIAYRADNKKQSASHSFEHYMIPRFTSFKSNSDKITELYTEISENELRNELIVNDCIHALNEGRTPVILTERTKHIDILADKLKDYTVIKLVGGMGNKYNTAIMDKLKSMPDDEQFIVIATGKYIGEGFDLPRLDTLLLSMPISWKGTLQQYAGRLHRSYEGKSEVRIYDYIDVHVPMLEKMYQKRLKGYSSIGYMTRCEGAAESVSSIFDNNNFLDVFIADILSAKHEVQLVSPFVSKRTLAKLIPLLAPAVGKITIITRPPEDNKNEIVRRRAEECIAMLKGIGFTIRTKSGIHQKFTVIDQRLIWYGSINFLSFGTSEESVMRLESVNIAAELVGSVEV